MTMLGRVFLMFQAVSSETRISRRCTVFFSESRRRATLKVSHPGNVQYHVMDLRDAETLGRHLIDLSAAPKND